jgi:hypothetical protein
MLLVVFGAGATWEASYAELACYAEGRREKADFEGTPLDALFDVSQARMVSKIGVVEGDHHWYRVGGSQLLSQAGLG